MEEARLHSAIGEIYERALNPACAASAGQVIKNALGIGSSIDFVSEPQGGRMVRLLSASGNFDAKARRDYADWYHERNVWFERALPHPPPNVRRGEELIDPEDFLKTEFCAAWCPRVGIFHMIGCTYPLPGGLRPEPGRGPSCRTPCEGGTPDRSGRDGGAQSEHGQDPACLDLRANRVSPADEPGCGYPRQPPFFGSWPADGTPVRIRDAGRLPWGRRPRRRNGGYR